MQRAVTQLYRVVKGLVGWAECEHYDSPLPGYHWYTTTTQNPNPNRDGFPNPGGIRSAADVPEGAVDLAIRHHRYGRRGHGIEEFPAGQSMVCATWCRAALTRRDMEARRDAGSRTFIVEVELRPSLHWMRNRDGSVNFHDAAVVHALAMATRLLVADRLLVVAWLALHRGEMMGAGLITVKHACLLYYLIN
jgi:hypothetical protein